MQGIVFLDKALFTSFHCTLPTSEVDDDDTDSFATDLPNFQISLSALLETLQIFGAAEASKYITVSSAFRFIAPIFFALFCLLLINY